jgi:hypothetical protein
VKVPLVGDVVVRVVVVDAEIDHRESAAGCFLKFQTSGSSP